MEPIDDLMLTVFVPVLGNNYFHVSNIPNKLFRIAKMLQRSKNESEHGSTECDYQMKAYQDYQKALPSP